MFKHISIDPVQPACFQVCCVDCSETSTDESKDEFGYGTTEDDNNHKQE